MDYAASSDAFTHAPQEFTEFFNQRRRWMASTLANIADLLASCRHTVRKNDNISYMFIFFQFALMVSTILGPSTIILMIADAFQEVFHLTPDTLWLSLILSIAPVLLYTGVCYTAKPSTQIYAAVLFTAFYAFVMVIVLVGILIEIFKTDLLSPTLIFVKGLTVFYIVSGVLHPHEFHCILHGFLYFLIIPSGFIILSLYALCNLHVVSWGTRERAPPRLSVPLVGSREDSATTGTSPERVDHRFTQSPNQLDDILHEMHILECDTDAHSSNELQSQLKKVVHGTSSLCLSGAKIAQKSFMHKTHELYDDEIFGSGPIANVTVTEMDFWKECIRVYLKPTVRSQEQIIEDSKSLIELRNKVCGAFLFVNILWLVLNFMLMKESTLSMNVFGRYINPASCVYLLVFAIVTCVQFIGMLLHRQETLMHLISVTNINIFRGR